MTAPDAVILALLFAAFCAVLALFFVIQRDRARDELKGERIRRLLERDFADEQVERLWQKLAPLPRENNDAKDRFTVGPVRNGRADNGSGSMSNP